LETAPSEQVVGSDVDSARPPQLVEPRSVPLGGPRAMTVRRTLPQRARSLIGGWCFVDHYGPDDVSVSGGMRVAGHPHTGLQTVSWLFRGEVEHLDTTGAHALVRPGELNVMTAGAGIAHSEFSTESTRVLRGVQLWVALPAADRFTTPGFEHYVPPVLEPDGATIRVLLGVLAGHQSPVRTFSPLLGAEITVAAGAEMSFALDRAFEHGVLVDEGELLVAGVPAMPGQLVYLPVGLDSLTLRTGAGGQTRLILLGGEPLGEQIVMWWNFVGRSHDEIASYREQWQRERSTTGGERFGVFPTQWGDDTLAAPGLPNARLRPRG
jgi:redox-sensitive bicupin YhaK (pirin superfamily)